MIPCNKKLATLSFVGGASKTLGFRIFNKGGSPIDVSNCTGHFAIIDCVNKYGKPIFDADMNPSEASDGGNIMFVNVPSERTVSLCGKYIYQITIRDDEEIEEPQQGDLYIYNNIDKDYLN